METLNSTDLTKKNKVKKNKKEKQDKKKKQQKNKTKETENNVTTINLNNKKIWFALPFIWTMIDYLMSLTEFSPWASIANTQAQEYLLPFIQFIEFTGMFGVTFWLLFLNISLFYFYNEKTHEKIIDSFAIFVFPLIISYILGFNQFDYKERIDFAILQPNISIHDKKSDNDDVAMVLGK